MRMYIFVPPLCRRGTMRVRCTVAPAWQPGDFIFGDLPIPVEPERSFYRQTSRVYARRHALEQACCCPPPRRFYRLSKLHRQIAIARRNTSAEGGRGIETFNWSMINGELNSFVVFLALSTQDICRERFIWIFSFFKLRDLWIFSISGSFSSRIRTR